MRWLPLLLLLPLLACAHTDPLTTFAKAGVAYTATVEDALDAAERAAVDASSWRLLDNDLLTNTKPEALQAADEQDRARRAQLERLRKHSGLLARYLTALAAIVDSDLPTEASKKVVSIWGHVAGAGKALTGSDVLPPADGLLKPIELIIDKSMHKRVRVHLEEHAGDLHTQLVLQEAILASLSRAVAHERDLARQAARRHTLEATLLDETPVADPAAWAKRRRQWILTEEEPRELTRARKAAKALREAFVALVGGKLDEAAARRLEAELRIPGLLDGLEDG